MDKLETIKVISISWFKKKFKFINIGTLAISFKNILIFRRTKTVIINNTAIGLLLLLKYKLIKNFVFLISGFSKKWCTPRVAILVSLSLALFFFLINSHFIFFVNSMSGSRSLAKSNQYLILHENISYLLMSQDISKDLMESIKTQEILLSMIQEKTREQESVNPFVYSKCLIKTNWPGYNFFFTNIFTWIDAGAQVILPFIIMVICNVNIIFKVSLIFFYN